MNKLISKKLIQFNSVSQNSNLDLINFCKEKFILEGYKIKLQKVGNKANLFAYKKCLKPRIIFSAHTDTVPEGNGWTRSPFDLNEKNGRYFGLGVSDMKIFIAIMLDIAKSKRNDLAFLLTFDEETDLLGARKIDKSIIQDKDIIIIGEPTENQIISGNKGALAYRMTIKGIAGHGSNPNNGINAIEKAAIFIYELKKQFKTIEKNNNLAFSYPKSSMNIGKIQGGSAINMIADKVVLEFEFRITSTSQMKIIEKMISKIILKEKIDCKLEKLMYLEPYIIDKELLDKSKKAGLNIVLGESYCTEANLFKKLTKNIIVFGPGDSKQAHKADESIEIKKIKEFEKDLKNILERF